VHSGRGCGNVDAGTGGGSRFRNRLPHPNVVFFGTLGWGFSLSIYEDIPFEEYDGFRVENRNSRIPTSLAKNARKIAAGVPHPNVAFFATLGWGLDVRSMKDIPFEDYDGFLIENRNSPPPSRKEREKDGAPWL
jgi:hypothetical protein